MDDCLKMYVLVGNKLVWGEFMIEKVSYRQIGDVVSFNSEIIRRELCHS